MEWFLRSLKNCGGSNSISRLEITRTRSPLYIKPFSSPPCCSLNKMSSKLSAISLFRVSSRLSLFKPKQGNSNPFKVPSCLAFYTSNRYYGFEDIKNSDDAVIMFDKMLQTKPIPSIVDFTKFLNILVKMKHFSQVILMFKTLILLEFPVNDYTMNIVINCYCNLNQVKSGFGTVATFIKRGYAPDIVSINCLIKGIFQEANIVKGACGNRMVDDAISLSSKMIQNGIYPTVVTYTTLIHGLCKFKRWDEADELLRQMVDSEIYPNIITFNALVNAYCKAGLIENAETVVEIMIERGISPDVVTYNALMNRYCSRGQLGKAKEIFNWMKEKGVRPNLVSYTTMINGYCKHDNIDYAWKFFEELTLERLKPDTTVYNCMMQGLFSVGRCTRALELFDEMKSVGVREDIYTHGIVLDGLLNSGKFQEALIFYHEVDSKGFVGHVSFYNIFIHGLCSNSQLDFARKVFNSLPLKGFYPDVITYNVMMNGLCREGLFEEVKELLEQMKKSGCFPNKVTYNTIIQGCLQYDDNSKACDIINMLRHIAEKDFTLQASSFSTVLQQMQGSDEDFGRKSLIQKLVYNDSRCLMA